MSLGLSSSVLCVVRYTGVLEDKAVLSGYADSTAVMEGYMPKRLKLTGTLSIPAADSGFGFLIDVRDPKGKPVANHQGPKNGIFVSDKTVKSCVGRSREDFRQANGMRFTFYFRKFRTGRHAGRKEAHSLELADSPSTLGRDTVQFRLRNHAITNATLADKMGCTGGEPDCIFYCEGRIAAIRKNVYEVAVFRGNADVHNRIDTFAEMIR